MSRRWISGFAAWSRRRPTTILGTAALLIVVALALIVAGRLPRGPAAKALEGWIGGLGAWGPLFYGVFYVLAVLALLPASVLTLTAGAAFGLLVGTITVSLASTTGAALAFLIARYLARETVARRLACSPKFAAIDRAISQNGWKVVGLLRLSPAVPFTLQNYLYGLTGIRFVTYVVTTWIAMLPGTFLYIYLGHLSRVGLEAAAGESARSRGPAEWAMLAVGLLATVAVTVFVTRLARRAIRAETGINETEPAS